MNTKTIVIICIVAVVLSSASLVLILMPRTFSAGFLPTEQGQMTRVTFTVGSPNGTISAIFNNTYASDITIHYIYVNNTQQPTWTCYVNGVATSPAVVPSNSGAQFNITTTVVANYTYDIKLVSAKGNTFEYTGRGTGTGTGAPEFLYLLILTIFILATLAILTTIVISKRKAHAQLEWASWQYTLAMLPTHALSRSRRANLNSLFWKSMFVFHFSNSTGA